MIKLTKQKPKQMNLRDFMGLQFNYEPIKCEMPNMGKVKEVKK